VRIQCADISVIICAYTLDRWSDLVAAVGSVRRQTCAPSQFILVIDHNDELLARAREEFPDLTVVPSTGPRGLSGARNTGLALATGSIVAFIDDDAVAHETWLEALAEGYAADSVLGVGGFIAPLWQDKRPGWFPEEFDWVLGCTYRGMLEGARVRNLIGANMSFRRDVLEAVGGFSHELGRTEAGSVSGLGDEETGACIRASQLFPGGVFIYASHAQVDHRVPASRTTWRYFRERCYGEGISKAHLARSVGSRDGLSSERRHAFVTLPVGVGQALRAFLGGDSAGLARAGALVAGLGFAGAGHVVGRFTPPTGAVSPAASPMPASALAPTAAPAPRGDAARPRLKVLMVTPRYFPLVGGVEHHVAQVARLMAGDADVTVLTTDTTGTLPPSETVDGVHVLRVRAWPRDRDYYVAPRIYRTVVDGDWDLVHVQSYHTAVAPLAMVAAFRAGIPYVVTFHGGGHSSAVRESLRGVQWSLLRPLLVRAGALVAVARFEAERFSAALRLPLERIVVIPNGSDLPTIPADEAERLRASGRQVIVSVGRLERYKGHQRVIEAMPTVLAEQPDSELRIVGSGPYQAELERLVERLGLREHVTIEAIEPSDRLAMARALAGSALFVLMSDFETHPLAVIEAVALGRPALVADTSGLAELARSGLARAIPLQSTTSQLARAIAEELRHPRTPPSFSAPTWQECAERLVALYDDILSSQPSAAQERVTARAQDG
jgi:glycosyltransferase involved in cell wall biosynthesis